MNITPNEIESIEEAGTLHGSPVKLIKTKGGFWIAVSRLKGRFKEEAIAAGSHPAIVKFNIEKKYPEFQQAMMKSENFSDSTKVESHSHYLSEDLRKSGHDVYSVQKDDMIDFHITKQDVNITLIKGMLKDDAIVLENIKMPEEFARAMAGATVEKAIACNAKKIKIGK